MTILKRLNQFCRDTSGAVSTEWVLLTAMILALSATVMTTIGTGTDHLSHDMIAEVQTADNG